MSEENKSPEENLPGEGAFDEEPDEEWELLQERKYRTAARKYRNREPEVHELNLTAMMDMLTILLVYLIKSYNSNPVAQLNKGVAPPASSSKYELKEALAISISSDQIMVDNRQVVVLVNGEFRPEDVQGQGSAKLITPLYEALDAEMQKQKVLAERGLNPESEGKALIVGDRKIPYGMLSSVMYTAGQTGLHQFQFVVLKK